MKKTLTLVLGMLIAGLAWATEKKFETQYFSIEVKGKGTPMLLIPGLSSSGEVWKGTVDKFSTDYTCHVLTLAGFAGQPAVQGDVFLPKVKDEVIRYLDTLDEPAVLMGHSLGGFLTYWIGSERPDLLKAAISVDGAPFLGALQMPGLSADSIAKAAEQMYLGMKSQTEEQFKAYQPYIWKTMIQDQELANKCMKWGVTSDKNAVARAMYELNTTDLRPELTKMEVPTLQLSAWAAYKQYGSTRQFVETAYKDQTKLHPNIKIEIHDESWHFIMFDEPEWFYSQVETFLVKS
ncbi:MAG: alpha/beta hydrolase [Bacteroidota bacterium]